VQRFLLATSVFFWPGGGTPAAAEPGACPPMNLPATRAEAPPSQYTDFCTREPAACQLEGDTVIAWSVALATRLGTVNAEVNAAVRFVPDWDSTGFEEHWSFPAKGIGDCEDIALEKRRRLVAAGLPGAALTCAIAFHLVDLYPHAVLLAEATEGTWVLDSLSDRLLCWTEVPYFFAQRELPDGGWLRYDQPAWPPRP
jgi:predicted transglutaminase-like cysteine proteinase